MHPQLVATKQSWHHHHIGKSTSKSLSDRTDHSHPAKRRKAKLGDEPHLPSEYEVNEKKQLKLRRHQPGTESTHDTTQTPLDPSPHRSLARITKIIKAWERNAKAKSSTSSVHQTLNTRVQSWGMVVEPTIEPHSTLTQHRDSYLMPRTSLTQSTSSSLTAQQSPVYPQSHTSRLAGLKPL